MRAEFVAAGALLGACASGCASILGLDMLERVDCIECDGGIAGGAPSKGDAAPPVDAGPTHAIRGTLSGLASGHLVVLENNGEDDLVVGVNGPFAFHDGVSERTPYSVAVLIQPTDQSCVVANGKGTVGTTDVTNVQVMCAAKTYTIGGTVSGLSGTGLVLQNNGGDNLPVAGNGAFSFPSGLANGANYAVSVATQPSNPTQSCVVSSGSGVVTGANVTGVVVNCSSGSFTVGGTVTGLVGSGLVVQNNGGNDLAISANGSFSFSTPIQSGNAYAVTIRAQPSVYEQTCTVSMGMGTIASANVSDVQIACGAVKSITLSGVGGQIPDGRSGCSAMPPMPGAPRTSDILIPADHFMINDVTVTLTNLNHSFAGDLTAQLQHVETQTTVDLFRRIDSTMSDACGSRARMQGTYRFGDSFSGDLWSFASNAASLPAGDYVCSTSAGAKTLLVGPGGFRGQGVAGTWRLTLTDSTSSDTGSFASWTLRLAP